MTEKIRAICIEGYCVSTAGLDEAQLKQIKPADRNDDGFISVYLHPQPDMEGTLPLASDDQDIKVHDINQLPIDVTSETEASFKLLRQFLKYRLFVEPQTRNRFHIYHVPSKNISHNSASTIVVEKLPNALKDLQQLGMFPQDTSNDIAILFRNETPLMKKERKPAFGGKCGMLSATPIVGLTYEYISSFPFFKTLKHELTHGYVHLHDPFVPRWLTEAAASHAENFDPSKTPIERLQIPTRLNGQWVKNLDELNWKRIHHMAEHERYQICHAFFLFIEDQYSFDAIKRFYEILRTNTYPAEILLLKVTGEQTISHLDKKFKSWLAQRIIERNEEIARYKSGYRKKICRTCGAKPRKLAGKSAQNNQLVVAHQIEDGIIHYQLSDPTTQSDASTRFHIGRKLYLGSNLMAHMDLKTKL